VVIITIPDGQRYAFFEGFTLAFLRTYQVFTKTAHRAVANNTFIYFFIEERVCVTNSQFPCNSTIIAIALAMIDFTAQHFRWDAPWECQTSRWHNAVPISELPV